MNSAASLPVSTPPIPLTLRFPPYSLRIIWLMAITLARAIGFTALAEYPAGVEYPSTHGSGRRESMFTPMTD